jgi:hypothetical protein
VSVVSPSTRAERLNGTHDVLVKAARLVGSTSVGKRCIKLKRHVGPAFGFHTYEKEHSEWKRQPGEAQPVVYRKNQHVTTPAVSAVAGSMMNKSS